LWFWRRFLADSGRVLKRGESAKGQGDAFLAGPPGASHQARARCSLERFPQEAAGRKPAG